MLGYIGSSCSVVPGWRSFYPGRGILLGLYTEKSLILISFTVNWVKVTIVRE